MKTSTRKSKTTTPKFQNRTRFNWGFHDAAQAVRQGWDTAANNYGFAHHGPLAGITTPADVLARHFDPSYARGWLAGYQTAKAGDSTTSSEPAWLVALAAGTVAY